MTKDELDLDSMENCVCFHLRWVTRAVTRYFDAELRRQGIRPTQTPILNALAVKPRWSMDELSECLGMERTTLVRNLRPLTRDGLVKAAGTGRGGRVSVSITSKGKKELQKVIPAWRAAQREVVKTLGSKRWSTILSYLDQAVHNLNN